MDQALRRDLDQFVVETMERIQVPGVGVGILQNGVEVAAGYGIINVDNPLPVTPETLFQIGSTSKTVTATAMMRLVEAGKLELEAPVRKYLPEFRLQSEEDAARARVIDLVTHVGGWVGDYFRDTGRGEDALARIVAKMANSPQLTPLGSVWAYNNAAFYVAGRIVEVVSGQSFEPAVRDLVFKPLGMHQTFFSHDDLVPCRVAAGHIVFEDGPRVARPWAMFGSAAPAGGVISTVPDQLRYARFHMGDGTAEDGARVLDQGTLDRMKAPVVLAGSMCDAVGVSWLLKDVGGHQVVMHGGATNGQMSSFMMIPAKQFALTVLANADRGREAHTLISNWILEHVAGVSAPFPEVLPLSVRQLEPYGGRYQAVLGSLELSAEAGTLIMRQQPAPNPLAPPGEQVPLPPPVRLGFLSDDCVISLDPPSRGARGEFVTSPDGASWFRWGGRIHRRMA
ncbi:MAG: serine hydrolase domain-containing protein [Anaerolineaceae bacterium]